MIANFEKLSEIYIDHLWFQFSAEEQNTAWLDAQNYSNQVSRWTAYLNLLVLNSFIPYLRENINSEDSSLEVMFSDRVSQSQTWRSYLWEFFNGTAIQIGEIRLAMLPDDRPIVDELRIVKEWVDIPQFAADYYLGVQVNLEERWVRVWGYGTHQQIKEKAEYDRWDRMYLLDAEDAIADLNILWMARELGIQERGEYELTNLPSLANHQKTDLIKKWGQPSAYSPRLDVTDEEFGLWGALLWDDNGRQELYERRIKKSPTKLREWLNVLIQDTTKMVQDTNASIQENWKSADFSFALEPIPTRSEEEIDSILNLLQPDKQDEIKRQAAGVLGEIGSRYKNSIPKTVHALTELLENTRDEETRWQAALSLGKLEPTHPEAGFRKARQIDLGIDIKGYTIALIVTIMPKSDDKLGVWIQVQPLDALKVLPPGLKLTILSASGARKSTSEARYDEQGQGKDKLIQRRFTFSSGQYFKVMISLDEMSITEDFIA